MSAATSFTPHSTPVCKAALHNHLPPALDLSSLEKDPLDGMICKVCNVALKANTTLVSVGAHKEFFCSSACRQKNSEMALAKATELFENMAMKKKSTYWHIARKTKSFPPAKPNEKINK